MPDLPAIEDIGRHVHDSFFRAMLADPARANGVIRAHWPRQLRWLLEGVPARPVDSTLVRDDLRQFRTDTLFLVGGEGSRPNALFLPEHKFGAVAGTPWQLRDYARTVLDGLELDNSLWLVSMVFDTGGDGGWNVPGVIDETSDDPLEILVQMRRDSAHFARQTRRIRYGKLSCEAVSRAMLGMMGLAGRRPYPRDLLERMWRQDAAGRVAGLSLQKQMLTFALATSDLAAEELLDLALETGLVGRELEMGVISVCRKTPFLEFEPASAVKFDPDLTGGFRVKWTWSATFGGKRRAGGDFGAHIGDFRKYRAWRAAGSPVRAALAGFPGDVRQLFVAGT